MCAVCSISRKDQTPPQQRVRAVQKLPSYLPSKLTYKCEAPFEHNWFKSFLEVENFYFQSKGFSQDLYKRLMCWRTTKIKEISKTQPQI